MRKKEKATYAASPRGYGGKDRQYISDEQRVFKAFYEKPKTMLQVAREVKVERAYICRYVAHLRDRGDIQVHHVGRCPISHWDGVQFLTTNKNLFKMRNIQLSFWSKWEGVNYE